MDRFFSPAAVKLLLDGLVGITHQVSDDVVVAFDVFSYADGLQGDKHTHTEAVKQRVLRPSRGVSMINN